MTFREREPGQTRLLRDVPLCRGLCDRTDNFRVQRVGDSDFGKGSKLRLTHDHINACKLKP